MGQTQFINGRQCIQGKIVEASLTIDQHGMIIPNEECNDDAQVIDLENNVVAPGFIELQTNGALGFHFTHYIDPASYQDGVQKLSHYLPSTGVTAFYPTVPTVQSDILYKVLPLLNPFGSATGASVLGAHVEGPFLAPSKKGAHNAENMHIPKSSTLEKIYGETNLSTAIKLVTLAPELPGALDHIAKLTKYYDIKVSMGHSAANYEEGIKGMDAGATLLTHTFNAMNPLHHREPGLAGLISDPNPPYFSLIADAIHLHPSIVSLAYHSCPNKAILITDSIELSGLPDGTYQGHPQIPHLQLKSGNKVTIAGTETLVGTCISLDQCVRNLMKWANIPIQKAVQTVTENVAEAMKLEGRGRLVKGARGDLVIMNDDGDLKETWVLGKKVWSKS